MSYGYCLENLAFTCQFPLLAIMQIDTGCLSTRGKVVSWVHSIALCCDLQLEVAWRRGEKAPWVSENRVDPCRLRAPVSSLSLIVFFFKKQNKTKKPFFSFFYFFKRCYLFLCALVCCLRVCRYEGARVTGTGLQVVVSHHVGARDGAQVFWKNSALNCLAFSPA